MLGDVGLKEHQAPSNAHLHDLAMPCTVTARSLLRLTKPLQQQAFSSVYRPFIRSPPRHSLRALASASATVAMGTPSPADQAIAADMLDFLNVGVTGG